MPIAIENGSLKDIKGIRVDFFFSFIFFELNLKMFSHLPMGIAINLFYFALFEGYFFSREGEVNDSDGSV